jgi:hypothetical protein
MGNLFEHVSDLSTKEYEEGKTMEKGDLNAKN